MAEFPATNWLGYSMNMVGTTPLDTNSATKAVQTSRRIIDFDEDDTRELQVDNKNYRVPKSIGVLEDGGISSGFVTYPSGSDAATAFRNDSSLAARFMSVTGDPSVSVATEKHHRRTVQYAYYCYGQGKYLAFLRNYADLLDNRTLLTGIRQLPSFDGENQETLDKYKSFFQRYGTHVITKVNFGSHLQLHVWASNSNSAVNSAWNADIKADYNGIPSGGEYDASIMSATQFKDYLGLKQNINSVYGGDDTFARPLATNPTYQAFQSWMGTTAQNPLLLSFVVEELWSLMKNSSDNEIVEFAPQIQASFNWIVNNPRVYRTSVTLIIESDWAEFGLLTPSAVVLPGDTVPPMTQYNEMKLTWGKEHSHDYKRETVQFYVINDGYPIDFYISHGSNGGTVGGGIAQVNMEGNHYVNDRITDNNYNTMWFYQAPVNAFPQSFRIGQPGRSHGLSAWDRLLEQYLHESKA